MPEFDERATATAGGSSPPHSRSVFPEPPEGLPAEFGPLIFHGYGMPDEASDPMLATNLQLLQIGGYTTLFCGHTHRPSVSRHGDLTVCNVGSAGMALDGDYRPSWGSWTDGRIEIHRVDYDVERIVHLIEKSDMPTDSDNYSRMFTHGVHWSRP